MIRSVLKPDFQVSDTNVSVLCSISLQTYYSRLLVPKSLAATKFINNILYKCPDLLNHHVSTKVHNVY